MEWAEYRREWRRRAFSGNLLKAELIAGLAALALAPLGASERWGPIVSWLPTLLFAAVAIGLGIYGCVKVPYSMHEELRKERDSLRDRLAAKVAIVGLIEETDPANATDYAIRYYSITVKNIGGEYLRDCLVKLTALSGREGGPRTKFLPISMRTQHQYWEGRSGGRFDLRPEEEKNVMLACLDERQGNSEIRLFYETDSYPSGIPRNDVYDLTVQVFGAPTAPSARYRMEVVDGFLRVSESDAASRIVTPRRERF
jgi:hypothetical protein